MSRRPNLNPQVQRLVTGVAVQTTRELRRVGQAPQQRTVEAALNRALLRGLGREEEAAVTAWLAQSRSTRWHQLRDWGITEPGPRALPTSDSHDAPQIEREAPYPSRQSIGAGESDVDESRRRWQPWGEMDRDQRLAFAGFLLEQDQLSHSRNLQRLGVPGVSRFFDAVRAGSYDGMGYTPQAEIQLFAQGRAWGVLLLKDGEEARLARRVYLTWKGWTRGGLALVFWDGSSATAVLGRRRAFTRMLSWFIPQLA